MSTRAHPPLRFLGYLLLLPLVPTASSAVRGEPAPAASSRWWSDSTAAPDTPLTTAMLAGTNTVVRLTAPLPSQSAAFVRVKVARP